MEMMLIFVKNQGSLVPFQDHVSLMAELLSLFDIPTVGTDRKVPCNGAKVGM